jgi:hypothetical protein
MSSSGATDQHQRRQQTNKLRHLCNSKLPDPKLLIKGCCELRRKVKTTFTTGNPVVKSAGPVMYVTPKDLLVRWRDDVPLDQPTRFSSVS